MTSSDPFEKHQIDHLSPSSLRLFRECLPVWLGKYLLRAPDEVGPGAWRGQAVEAGVDRLLYGFDGGTALEAMQQKWDQQAQGIIEPDAVKEYDALHDFLIQARIAYDGMPTPLQRARAGSSCSCPASTCRSSATATGGGQDRGDDLKTTWRMPANSQPDPSHVEQVACYSMHFGVPFHLTYVTPKRWTRYEVTPLMASEAWDRVIETAHAVRSVLAHVDSAHDALSMFAPDYTSYYFRPAMAEAVRNAKAVRVLTR